MILCAIYALVEKLYSLISFSFSLMVVKMEYRKKIMFLLTVVEILILFLYKQWPSNTHHKSEPFENENENIVRYHIIFC